MNEEQRAPPRIIGILFVAAILAGSFLLFLVQPMVARMALPRLGGAPAVWNSAMLVYQALLLGGYAYAHLLGRVPARRQAAIHLAVLLFAALWLPIGLSAMQLPADAEPAVWVPWLLIASIGPLFFAVSAQAPLLQRWFALAGEGRDPYALYAASNIGSFGGLLAYPLVVEPLLDLRDQSLLWSGGYVVVLCLVAACALRLPRTATQTHVAATSTPPAPMRVATWIALAFVPSGLMLATSTFLTTDIVAVPLLWVLPLGLYLLSFSIAFATRRFLAELLTRFAPLTILLFGGLMIAGQHEYPYLNAGMVLLLLFMAAVALHTRLYDLRPEPDRLTGFYLAMSFGGALGGIFAGLIAPIVFDWTYEFPILILAAGLLAPQGFLIPAIRRLWPDAPERRLANLIVVALLTVAVVWLGLANPAKVLGEKPENIGFLVLAAVGLFVIGVRPAFGIVLAGALFLFGGYRALQVSWDGHTRTRSYFGVYTIRDYPDSRTLAHGTTLHGVQLKGASARQPTSYYVARSGVGLAMQAAPALYGPNARIGVVGLGAGTLACYAKPGQQWQIFEIDPAVVGIARNPANFTFLSGCLPDARIIVGDARLRLAEEAPASIDLLALDAFSSDAVPMHLLTREAFATYGHVLSPKGLLLVHISNRFLALEPVVAAAGAGAWYGARLSYIPSPEETRHGYPTASDWIALTRDIGTLATLMDRGGEWHWVVRKKGFRPWTDDYATILPILNGAQ